MTKFGRFEILREIGRGGMGVVFRAHDPDMNRDVAIKVLRLDLDVSGVEREEITRRFEREAQSAGSLSHPNIVTHYERGCLSQYNYIVMEFIEGRSLHDVMSHGPRPDHESALSMLQQIAQALDYAHSRGIVHRDIKPANILVQSDRVVKIADFGIARRLLASSATAASVAIGSPHYMAPEQIEAKAVTGSADQWSLAVTAYELLAGRKPFMSDSVAALFQQILAGAPPDPTEFEPAIPAASRAVLDKALSKKPEERFETCSTFVEALKTALSDGGHRLPKPAAVRWSRWVAAAFAIVCAAGVGTWWLLGSSKADQAVVREERPPRPAETRKNLRDGLTYAWIGAGQFRMGCSPEDSNCHDDEPPHDVTLSRGYWMGRTEVTVGSYKRFSAGTGAALPSSPPFNPNWANENAPISNVRWQDAAGFCRWAQGRLPTEAEWEFAARAGTAGVIYGDLKDVAWSRADSETHTHDVGGKRPNAFGLYDMIGNLWEWTADRYNRNYYNAGPGIDPTGPETGDFRVLRGGSWLRDAVDARVSVRYPLLPGDPDHAVGFRCALPEMP